MKGASYLVCALLSYGGTAFAAPPGTPATVDAGASARSEPSDCVERLPAGKARPILEESFPAQGTSGHALTLRVVVEHGKGETVLPGGFRFGLSEESGKVLERSGFFIPDPDGGAGPTLRSGGAGERVKTSVEIPFVALPEKPGRQRLTLPKVPITIARASGEITTVCTSSHDVTLEDPIANTPNPEPRRNPDLRRERELWTTAKNVTIAALIALVIGAFVAWLIGKWLRRPKPVPAPPPPRPPWEVALEELFDIKNAGFIREQRFAEYFDRVSDTVRNYLGARYGFDGLECTTRETLGLLHRIQPPIVVIAEIEAFLRQADLVKFARLTPTEAECELSLERGEHIVRKTVPQAPSAPPAPVDFPPPPAPPSADTFAPPGPPTGGSP